MFELLKKIFPSKHVKDVRALQPLVVEINGHFQQYQELSEEQLKGKTFRANFYKCGDMLSVPHYVTWNPVGTPKPDYHRPEYFGELKFV